VARTQRWRERCPRWRPADEGGFDPDRYGVAELADPAAAAFDRRHHYAATLPATTHRYGVLGFGRAGQQWTTLIWLEEEVLDLAHFP
jgi:hypothetical protein